MYKENKWRFAKLQRESEGVKGQCECKEAPRITAAACGLSVLAAPAPSALQTARDRRHVP